MTPAPMYEGELVHSRQHMITTLELFFEHTKYTLNLMIAVVTAAAAIVAFCFGKDSTETLRVVAPKVAGYLLILIGPIASVSYLLVHRYYKLYVTSYVYAARVHKKHACAAHPWFVDLEARVVDLDSQDAVAAFIDSGRVGDGHSGFFYSRLIILLGVAGVILGIALIWRL